MSRRLIDLHGGTLRVESTPGEGSTFFFDLEICRGSIADAGADPRADSASAFKEEELPVIFLTARNQDEDLVVGLAAGANDYLPKPVSKSELLARVRTHIALLLVNRQLAGLVAQRTALSTLTGTRPARGP